MVINDSQYPNVVIEHIAQICHEANRALQVAAMDPNPSPAWEDAPTWQQNSALNGVLAGISGKTPRDLHESWWEEKIADGWVLGPVKDEEKKTHPAMVPYSELPDNQIVKDHIFLNIVRGYIDGLEKG